MGGMFVIDGRGEHPYKSPPDYKDANCCYNCIYNHYNEDELRQQCEKHPTADIYAGGICPKFCGGN